MISMRLWPLIVGVACLAFRPALAEEAGARCMVRIVHALHEGQGIDPHIAELRPSLEKPPFTAWKQFKLLDEKTLELDPKGSANFALPNGKEGTLTYVDHLLDRGGKHRLRLRLAIHDGPRVPVNTLFVLDEGGVVLQAGQHYQKGLLILGIRCEIKH
jgi:hypothetical protein